MVISKFFFWRQIVLYTFMKKKIKTAESLQEFLTRAERRVESEVEDEDMDYSGAFESDVDEEGRAVPVSKENSDRGSW